MKTSVVAKRYAKAIFIVTKQKGIHQKAMDELRQLQISILGTAGASKFFLSPIVPAEKKLTAVRDIVAVAGCAEEVANALLLLAEKNRFSHLPFVIEEFQNYIDAEDGVTRGVVYSAQPLSAPARGEIEQKIKQALHKRVLLNYEEDSRLLGGVVAQVGGWTFDDSLETHLKKLNEDLNRRAN